MKDTEIKDIVDTLTASSNTETAFFDIRQYAGDDEYYIRANRDGLKLYAAELLYAAAVEDDKTWSINSEGRPWLDEKTTLIDYIEVTNTRHREDVSTSQMFVGRLEQLGYYTVASVGAIALVVGLVNIVKWIIWLF